MTPEARRAILSWVAAALVVWTGVVVLLLGGYPR